MTANIVPIHNKVNKILASNYTPISLIVKVMEWIIHHHVIEELSQSSHLSVHQFSFRLNHFIVLLLLNTVHDWALNLERRYTSHCLFLDFAKAFAKALHLKR